MNLEALEALKHTSHKASYVVAGKIHFPGKTGQWRVKKAQLF